MGRRTLAAVAITVTAILALSASFASPAGAGPARSAATGTVTVSFAIDKFVKQGKGLAAATGVSFGGAKARFRIVTDNKLVATVPKRAKSGPVLVTSALKQVKSRASFRVLAGA